MPEALAQRPQPGAYKKDCERNNERRGGGHQPVNANALAISLARTAEDGESSHVGREDGQKENHRADGAAGEEEILGVRFAFSECDETDRGDHHEIKKDNNDRNHWWISSLGP